MEQQLKQKDQEIMMLKKKIKYLEFNMQQEKYLAPINPLIFIEKTIRLLPHSQAIPE